MVATANPPVVGAARASDRPVDRADERRRRWLRTTGLSAGAVAAFVLLWRLTDAIGQPDVITEAPASVETVTQTEQVPVYAEGVNPLYSYGLPITPAAARMIGPDRSGVADLDVATSVQVNGDLIRELVGVDLCEASIVQADDGLLYGVLDGRGFRDSVRLLAQIMSHATVGA